MTPSARSTNWLRKRGFIVANVEKRLHIPGAPWPRTVDCFGFADLLAAGHGLIVLVQVTSSAHLGEREQKIIADQKLTENAVKWIAAGGKIFLHGWAKRGKRGKRKVWTLIEKEITFKNI